MCGIIWGYREDGHSIKRIVKKRFHDQRSRGVQGFGFLEVEKNIITSWHQARYENQMADKLKESITHEILFHHRYPTSTINLPEATHPIRVSHKDLEYDYYVVHNGVIGNCDDLKKDFEKEGYVYTTIIQETLVTRINQYIGKETYNDSESFAIDIAQVIEKKLTSTRSTGSIAFIAYQVKKDTGVIVDRFCGRNNSNPLVFTAEHEYMTLTSKGANKDIEAHVLFRIDTEKKTLEKVRDLTIGFGTSEWFQKKNTPVTNPAQQSFSPKVIASVMDSYGMSYEFATVDEIGAQFASCKVDMEEGEENLAEARHRKDDSTIDYWEDYVNDVQILMERLKKELRRLSKTHPEAAELLLEIEF